MASFLKEHFGNPSSLYPIGRQVKEMINEAREHVAKALGANKSEIYFTGSGTEADNHAILGVLDALPDKREFVTSAIEHPAVQETALYLEKKGYKVTYVPVDKYGTVDLDFLRDAVTPQTALVSIMHANNEIGTIQPIEDDRPDRQGERRSGPYRRGPDLRKNRFPCGPTGRRSPLGLGAQDLRPQGRRRSLCPERDAHSSPSSTAATRSEGLRAGTENTIGIIGFGEAARILPEKFKADKARIEKLADRLRKGIEEKIPKVRLTAIPKTGSKAR